MFIIFTFVKSIHPYYFYAVYFIYSILFTLFLSVQYVGEAGAVILFTISVFDFLIN